MTTTLTNRPATAQQLAAIERRADLIERTVVGPFTRGEATQQIKALDARIAELRADGVIA